MDMAIVPECHEQGDKGNGRWENWYTSGKKKEARYRNPEGRKGKRGRPAVGVCVCVLCVVVCGGRASVHRRLAG